MDRIDRPLVAALHQRGAIAKKKEGKKGKKVNKTRQESKQRPSTARSSNNRVAPREEKLLRSSASGARSRAIQGWLSNKTVPRGGGFLCAILKFHASGKYAEGVSLEFNHYAASRSVHAALLPALRAASHCWSASDGEFLEGLDPAGDIPGSWTSWTTLVRSAFIRVRLPNRVGDLTQTRNLVSFLSSPSLFPFFSLLFQIIRISRTTSRWQRRLLFRDPEERVNIWNDIARVIYLNGEVFIISNLINSGNCYTMEGRESCGGVRFKL